jgi:putative Holliday junction resolvase
MNHRILALDIGEKRIGVAMSDALGIIAQPVKTLIFKGIEQLTSELIQMINEHNIKELIIGMPYNMKGQSSKKTEEIRKIKNSLESKLNIPIIEIDERLTTKIAERTLYDLGKKPSKNRDKIDQIAAMYILQSYLDKKKYSGKSLDK